MEKYKINLGAFERLPLYGLPNFVQSLISEISAKLDTPQEYATATLLAVSSVAAGKEWEVKTGDFSNRLHDFFMLIGDSGRSKSTAFDRLSAPLIKAQKALQAQFCREMDAYRTAEASGRGRKRKDAEPVTVPPRPREQCIYIDEVTPERRNELLSHTPKGILWNADEIPLILKDPTGRGRFAQDANAQIKLWNGNYFAKSTITGGSVSIDKVFCTIIGGIQPNRMPSVFSDAEYVSSGYLQRYLLFWPDAVTTPPSVEDPQKESSLSRVMAEGWECLFENLYWHPSPSTMRPDAEAANVYSTWKVLTQQMQVRGGVAAEVWSKLHRHVLRLSGLAHVLSLCCGESNDAETIGAKEMRWACDASFYFFAQQMKAVDAIRSAQSGDGRGAQPKRLTKEETLGMFLRTFGRPQRGDGSEMNLK